MSLKRPSLGLENFIQCSLEVESNRTVFYITFSKEELVTAQRTLCLKEAPEYKKYLFEFLLFLARYFGGSVYSVMLEPALLNRQEQVLNPFLRCEMSVGVLFLFVLPHRKTVDIRVAPPNKRRGKNREANGVDGVQETSNDSLLDDPVQDVSAHSFAQLVENIFSSSETVDIKTEIVKAVKKLICCRLGLISFNKLVLLGGGFEFFKHINWSTNYVTHSVGTVLTSFSGKGKKTSPEEDFTFPECFGIPFIIELTNRYFMYKINSLRDLNKILQSCSYDDISEDGVCENALVDALWQFHISNLTQCPIVANFLEQNRHGAVPTFCEELTQLNNGIEGFILPINQGIICFKLNLCDYFPSKYNITNLPVYNAVINGANAEDVQLLKQCDMYTWGKYTIQALASKTDETEQMLHDNFRIIFPHLANIRDILLACNTDFVNPAAYQIILHTLYNQNHMKGTVKVFHERLGIVLQKSLDFATAIQNLCLTTEEPAVLEEYNSCPLKCMYKKLMEKFFLNHFGLTRLKQAITLFHYIICNAAPRWRTGRMIIINCTPPGEGKTFTNKLLQILFQNVQLVEILGGITPACFKYGEIPELMKTIVLDDVGLGENTLKNAKHENNMIAGNFKNLLDNGYVLSVAADRQESNRGNGSKHKQYH
uniref:Uncharacterized protein n=1 Tax=Ranid herpesvirus 4 TaxID=2849006 RepID=A0A8F3CIK7_9VIRU|nr:MAG: hypothetical protein [Ranid herpesvirus 4]